MLPEAVLHAPIVVSTGPLAADFIILLELLNAFHALGLLF
jgi:hypothetical protein